MFSCTRFYVRDGALIGDLRDSLQPMIWRMELSRVHAVGFRVQQDGAVWNLGMEGAAGTFSVITSYPTQAAANKALSGIGRGLKHNGWMRRSVQSVLLLVLLLAGLYILYNVGLSFFETGGQQQAIMMPDLPQFSQPTGQALSADQALRAPPPLSR